MAKLSQSLKMNFNLYRKKSLRIKKIICLETVFWNDENEKGREKKGVRVAEGKEIKP